MTAQSLDRDRSLQIHKLGVKLFLCPTDGLDFGDFIAIFNQWIQDQPIPEHLLIDVHDYRHVHNGPGVLLVGHQGNFSLDFGEGRPGLVYYRKQPMKGAAKSCLRTCLQILLQACRLLLQTEPFGKSLEFETNEILIFSNDRLQAPNRKDTRVLFEQAASELLHEMAEGNGFFSYPEADPRDRFAVALKFPQCEIDTLLQHLTIHT